MQTNDVELTAAGARRPTEAETALASAECEVLGARETLYGLLQRATAGHVLDCSGAAAEDPARQRAGRPSDRRTASIDRRSIWFALMPSDVSHPPETDDLDDLDDVAMELLVHATMLVRLVQRELPGDVGPTAAGVMTALEERPHRISELVGSERLAQPTLTALVIALEQRGWVARTRDERDRRAVWVSLTRAGRARKRQLHAEVDTLLHERLAETPLELRRSLRDAVAILEQVVQAMRRSPTSEQGQPPIGAAGSTERRRSSA